MDSSKIKPLNILADFTTMCFMGRAMRKERGFSFVVSFSMGSVKLEL